MFVKRGSGRIVFVFPSLRLVIKFPIFHAVLAFSPFFSSDFRGWRWKFLKNYMTWPLETKGGFRCLMFKGLVANWTEFYFYWRTRNPFLQPTLFSFFGLMNIMPFAEPCKFQEDDLWCQLYELTGGKVFKDAHHFADPLNFCFFNQTLRMIDYGSRGCQLVVSEFGEKIVRSFNPQYCWEEEKKKLSD